MGQYDGYMDLPFKLELIGFTFSKNSVEAVVNVSMQSIQKLKKLNCYDDYKVWLL